MRLKVSKTTVIRTICAALALLNQILTATGHSILPFSDEEINQIVSVCWTAASTVWVWWKNNSFTQNALHADAALKEMNKFGENKNA